MLFRPSVYTYKRSKCRRLANHLAAAARAMGLWAKIERSAVSASHYVYVAAAEDSDDLLKIRVSDHADRHGGSDWHVRAGNDPSHTISRLAAHFGREVPAGYRAEDFEARSASAKAAAETRLAARQKREAAMVQAVTAALRPERSVSKVAAGRIVDRLLPGIPRAQRSRIADEASRTVKRERALAESAGNVTTLVALATTTDDWQLAREARAALRALVGEERYRALRPEDFPDFIWLGGAQ